MKTTKAVKAATVATTNSNSNDTQALRAFELINCAIESRIKKAENSNMLRELNISKKLFTLHLAKVLVQEKADVQALAVTIAVSDKNSDSFFAQKALIKMMKVITTLSQDIDNLDRYTRNFLTSMLLCKGTISNAEIMQGISKEVVTENILLRKNALFIAASTATTQTSSSRRMLAFAKIINYDSALHKQSFSSEAMQKRIAKIVCFQA